MARESCIVEIALTKVNSSCLSVMLRQGLQYTLQAPDSRFCRQPWEQVHWTGWNQSPRSLSLSEVLSQITSCLSDHCPHCSTANHQLPLNSPQLVCVHAWACRLFSRKCEWNSLVVGMRRIEITTHMSQIQSSVVLFLNKKQDYMNVFIPSNSWQ